MNWFHKILLLGIILVMPIIAYAQKTDTVFFYNGDRAVCEIKSLAQGKLTIKTVAMGTISVEWRNVSNINSDKYYEIILSDHSRIFGRIMGADSMRNVTIQFGVFQESVPILDIVKLQVLNQNFWKELDGFINAGFSFTRATSNFQINSSGEAKYRTSRTSHLINFASNISANETSESEKIDAGYRFQLFYKRNVYNAIDLRWERNTELGISTRLISTLSGGYSPVENSFNVLSFEIGGSVNREFSTEDVASNNAELLIRGIYDLFVFEKPKIFLKIKSETFPSLTVQGRLRSNIDASVTWDLFKDFTLGISYWGNYDSDPVNTTGLQYDYGITTSIGYKF